MTYREEGSGPTDVDLVDLRRSLGDLTQAEAARLLNVTPNTWARWERGVLQVHPARADQVRRLQRLVMQYRQSEAIHARRGRLQR